MPEEETVKIEQAELPGFGEDLMVITDADMSDEIYGVYQGYKFVCPVCKTPSIMVNSDMIPMCLKCGRRALIKSAFITKQNALRTVEKPEIHKEI